MDAETLKMSSQKWMGAALAAFSEGQVSYDLAVHHAGIAVEHLLKAYLASLHPALIVEARDFDSLLHATGNARLATAPASRAKTIGLTEAHGRVHKILRGRIPVDKKALEPVAHARNGVAHSGIHDVAEVHTVFTTCLRLIDSLLHELKLDSGYWGDYLALHEQLIEERVQDARLRLESKLARARAIFEQRYRNLDTRDREVVLAVITQRPLRYMSYDVARQCPACSSSGWLMGETHIDHTNEVVVFTPYIFACAACDLDVENEEFWELDDLSNEVVLDISLDDFYADQEPDFDLLPDAHDGPPLDAEWEPDEDFLRGR